MMAMTTNSSIKVKAARCANENPEDAGNRFAFPLMLLQATSHG